MISVFILLPIHVAKPVHHGLALKDRFCLRTARHFYEYGWCLNQAGSVSERGKHSYVRFIRLPTPQFLSTDEAKRDGSWRKISITLIMALRVHLSVMVSTVWYGRAAPRFLPSLTRHMSFLALRPWQQGRDHVGDQDYFRNKQPQCIMKKRPLQKAEAGCGAASAALRCAGASLRYGGA